MKSVGIHIKSQQDIVHSILQEDLCQYDFVYVNIHLEKYNVHFINSNAVNNNNYGSQQQSQESYPNIFNFYENRDEAHSQ